MTKTNDQRPCYIRPRPLATLVSENQLQFTADRANSRSAPEGATAPPTVHVGSGRLEVLGLIGTSTPCYDLGAAITREGRLLALTITARAQNVPCIQIPALFAYRAAVDGLAPDTFQLMVVHAYEGTEWSGGRVLETSVSVP